MSGRKVARVVFGLALAATCAVYGFYVFNSWKVYSRAATYADRGHYRSARLAYSVVISKFKYSPLVIPSKSSLAEIMTRAEVARH